VAILASEKKALNNNNSLPFMGAKLLEDVITFLKLHLPPLLNWGLSFQHRNFEGHSMSKKDTQMAHKYRKRCSLFIRKMQIKTIMKYHFIYSICKKVI
jgi:hypothetical protein